MYITPVNNRFPCFSGDANIDNNCFMENREQQILSEIKSMVASIRSQLERLDAKMVEFHQAVDPEGFKKESINVIIDDVDMLARPAEEEIVEIPLGLDIPEVLPAQFAVVSHEEIQSEAPAEVIEEVFVEDEPEPKSDEPLEEPVQESIEEPALDDDLPFGDLPEDEQFPEEEPLSEDEQLPKPQLQHETVKEELVPEEEDDDIPGFFDEPEIITVAAKASAAAKPTINDAHSTDQAWRKDMPGTPVKDIRSAISLNDRVFYINNLFNEDAQAFVNTLSNINSMASLDEVVDFVTDQFPHWNLNSDVVYRFMMAVRRKVK